MTPKEDCERLLNEVLPLAERMLGRHGEFYPFGGYIERDGNIVHLGAQDGDSDHPKPKDLIFVLRDTLQNLARTDRCDATALIFDVSIALPGSGRKGDAIQACLDHRDGYSAEVFFAYQIVGGEVVYGETFAQQGKGEIFT
jgi:hypothetical protein